jgi:hypothetical protein
MRRPLLNVRFLNLPRALAGAGESLWEALLRILQALLKHHRDLRLGCSISKY